jgi:hypothetical protein
MLSSVTRATNWRFSRSPGVVIIEECSTRVGPARPPPLQPPHLRPNVLFLAHRNDGHPPNMPMTVMQSPRVATQEHDIQSRKSNVRPRVLRLRESPAADRCGKGARITLLP